MKLWSNRDKPLNILIQKKIDAFTIGNDKQWDVLMARHDVKGSIAHVKMLQSIKLLSEEELVLLLKGLDDILIKIDLGQFEIEDGVEDVHSQIELLLTRNYGDIGKKIHSGRSRNDQSLLDIKLYIRQQLKETTDAMQILFNQLIELSNLHQNHLMPGYTHMQLAMPSSFGLWFGAFAESLCDDMEMILAAYKVANKNPLGSAAGYGSSFPLNRRMTTDLLAFDDMNYNVVYAQMTRGKTEKITAMALASVAATLSKLAMDICLFAGQNFEFITFPTEFTTGSSIMPHKKNLDVFELIRAKANRLQAIPNEITLLINNLPSGYHRDLQLTKECLFPAFIEIKNCIEMAVLMLQNIVVRTSILESSQYSLLFTVETVNQMVLSGVPFREAYRTVAEQVEQNTFLDNKVLNHTHEGSMGNLCNDKIKNNFETLLQQII